MLSSVRPQIVKILQKTKLNKLAHKLYYNYFHGFNSSIKDTLPAVERCLLEIKKTGVATKGDYYEFGIFKGYTFWHSQQFSDSQGLENIKFYGFDSFEGLPEVEGVDQTKHDEFYKGQYKCGKDQVIENLNSKGVDWNRTSLIEGYFNESLNSKTRDTYQMDKVALALIDCDLYASTIDVLTFIRDMLVDGSILMFDDWNSFSGDNEKGERLAFSEFLSANKHLEAKECFSYGPYGQVFVIHM